jgi:hypothetical protein
MRKFKGARINFYDLMRIKGFSQVKVHRLQLDNPTIFDKVENSRSMFVSSLDRRWFWEMGIQMQPMEEGFSKEEALQYYNDHNYEVKKRKLMSDISNEIFSPRNLLMAHFHRPDFDHHLYHDPDLGVENREWIERTYRKLDKDAGNIKNAALDVGYDTIIFISDHGLPTLHEHNENAFYSCNHELFGDDTPHITDFHDKILELTGSDTAGIDL